MKHIKAKKTLGQNFLKDKKIIEKIVEKSNLSSDDIVLEIGPGKGHLTQFLLLKVKKLYVIEKDARLIPFLEDKFSSFLKEGKLEIIEGDALDFDYSYFFQKKKYKIVANLPYYITGAFLSKILEKEKHQPASITLLLQKEVVERITGEKRIGDRIIKDKKNNLLKLSIDVYGKSKFLFSVPAKFFSPKPKIDSAVLFIDQISKDFFKKDKINEKVFFAFLKLAFSQKRKTIIKNLKNKYSSELLLEVFGILQISIQSRAEDLSLQELKEIFLQLKDEG